jgi:uncharacterized membrane protein
MVDACVNTKSARNTLTIVLITAIVVLAVVGVVISILYPNFVFELQPGVQEEGKPYVPGGAIFETIYILLTMATDVLYLIGGGVVFFGGVLVTIRFFQIKLKDPDKPSEITRHLSGYLTLGLAFFIGAEIVKTVVVRTFTEFELLILTIVSRGLFSLILYLERRWHGPAETE